MGKTVNIGGRIHNPEVGNVVTGANEILDDTKGKKQNVINTEVDTALAGLDSGKQDKLTFDQTPTESSTNPVTSGGVYAADQVLQQAIEAILLLIPSAASALNQLADKSFVNSSIATASATFRGTYNLVSDLHLSVSVSHQDIATALASVVATADNNDYAFVQIPTSDTSSDIRVTERYKFNGTAWQYEYDLNNSGFTAQQWAAINSAITSALVGKLSALPTADELATLLAGKQATLTFDSTPTSGSANPVTSGGLYDKFEAIIAKIPSDASANNKLVAENRLAAYVGGIIGALDATFDLTSTDGHVTLRITQTDGLIASVQVLTSDIASAAQVSQNTSDIATLQDLYNALQQSAPEIIQPTDTWPVANPSDTVIYRVIDRVNTPPEYYSDYMWNGTVMVLMATYNNAIDPRPKKDSANLVTSGGVFDNMGALDVSELNASGGTLATYADLSAVLAAIPSDYQKGGMSIKFVHTSDNKYVQYRYMGTAVTGTPNPFLDTSNWQGVDDVPTAGSDNLVESAGVYNLTHFSSNSQVNGIITAIYIERDGADISGSITGFNVRVAILNVKAYNRLKIHIGDEILDIYREYNDVTAALNVFDNNILDYNISNTKIWIKVLPQSSTLNFDALGISINPNSKVIKDELALKILGIEKENAFSNNSDVNRYISGVALNDSSFDITRITKVWVRVAALSDGAYHNIVYLRDNSSIIFQYDESYSTQQSAISNFEGIKPLHNNAGYIKLKYVNAEVTLSADNVEIFVSDAIYVYGKLKEDIAVSNSRIEDVSKAVDDIIDTSVNLFNPENALLGIYTPSFSPSETNYNSGLIPVASSETYKFTANTANLGGNAGVVALFNSSKMFMRTVYGSVSDDVCTYTVESDVAYIAFNIGSFNRLSTAMFTKASDFPESYVPYYKNIKTQCLPNIIINSLYNKKISLNGDSLCQSMGDSVGGYGKIIADRNDMQYQNIAVGGGTIASGTYAQDGVTPKHWICRTIQNMDTDADYIIIEGGGNDASLQVPLGNFNPTEYSDTFDDETFYGALESIMYQLYYRFPGKKIGYIISQGLTGGWRYGSDTYVEAVLSVCKKWGVPCINLQDICPIFVRLDSSIGLSIKETYTHNQDGWHPNKLGYEKYFCDKIEAWMRML